MARTWGKAHPLHTARAGLTPAAALSWTPGQGWLRLCGHPPPRGTSARRSSRDMPDPCSSWSRRGGKHTGPFCVQQDGHLHQAPLGLPSKLGCLHARCHAGEGHCPRGHDFCSARRHARALHPEAGPGRCASSRRRWAKATASPDCDNHPRLRTHHCPHSTEEAQGPARRRGSRVSQAHEAAPGPGSPRVRDGCGSYKRRDLQQGTRTCTHTHACARVLDEDL